MCIITDENDIVVSVSLIPGTNPIPSNYNVYFPVNGQLPKEGERYLPNKGEEVITVQKAEHPFEEDFGAILFGGEYIAGRVVKKEIDQVLFLPGTYHDPWKDLIKLRIKCNDFKEAVTYKDFVIENTYYWFLPIMILTDNNQKYRNDNLKSPVYNHIFDSDFCKGNLFSPDLGNDIAISPGKIHASLLGHGYTYGTLPSDGSGRLDMLYVNLSNGDRLAGYCWIWFNK